MSYFFWISPCHSAEYSAPGGAGVVQAEWCSFHQSPQSCAHRVIVKVVLGIVPPTLSSSNQNFLHLQFLHWIQSFLLKVVTLPVSDRLESNTSFCPVWNTGTGDLSLEYHELIYDLTALLKHKQTFKEHLWRYWGHHFQHRDLQEELFQSLISKSLCKAKGHMSGEYNQGFFLWTTGLWKYNLIQNIHFFLKC